MFIRVTPENELRKTYLVLPVQKYILRYLTTKIGTLLQIYRPRKFAKKSRKFVDRTAKKTTRHLCWCSVVLSFDQAARSWVKFCSVKLKNVNNTADAVITFFHKETILVFYWKILIGEVWSEFTIIVQILLQWHTSKYVLLLVRRSNFYLPVTKLFIEGSL